MLRALVIAVLVGLLAQAYVLRAQEQRAVAVEDHGKVATNGSGHCRTYIIYGQGGYITSFGFGSFGSSLETKGYPVSYWDWGQPDAIVRDVLQHSADRICLLGYSLGADAVTWVSSGWQGGQGLNSFGRVVNLVVAYDPTKNTTPTPLTDNVRRALLYYQTGLWPTSIFFGRGKISSAEGGPKIEEHEVSNDHLYVQFNGALHAITEKALEEVGQ